MNDYLDLRDLSKELRDLRDERDSNPTAFAEDGDVERLEALEELDKDIGGLDDAAADEPTLIPDFAFKDYARDFAEDVCYLGPLSNYIDWKAWADAVKMDYTSYDFDGVTYWRRA